MSKLLDRHTVVDYLLRRGVLDSTADVEVTELGGGVSNVVLSVVGPTLRAVVKQSLPQLRVADEWLAKQERANTEADVLRVAAELTPDAAPALIHSDPDAFVLVMQQAPDGWVDWKQPLLKGDADPAVASEVGRVLGVWHSSTTSDSYANRFNDHEAFEQLRVDPYYRTLMKRRPEVAETVGALIETMVERRKCLVHGDYSPKNVLTGDGKVWVVDFEVAHFGDPAFDLGFMNNHLMLKAVHRPHDLASYRECAVSFGAAYRAQVPDGFAGPDSHVWTHVGALMAARVDGKSPAEYLSGQQFETARYVSGLFLQQPPSSVVEAWKILEESL